MSEHLVESIIDKNYVLSENILRERLNAIMEKKLYEKKRMVAAKMDEALGGMTQKEIDDRKKAGYKKASEVLGDPTKKDLPPLGHKFKKIKKKISETVEVKPDTEGRVRGGQPKPEKGTLKRKALAVAVKGIRKTAKAVGNVAAGTAVASQRAKSAFDMYKQQRASQQASSTSQEPKRRKAPPTSVDSQEVEPKKSWAQRNANTLLGRSPDYDPKDPKNKSRGGRAGTLARKAIGAIASDIVGSIG
jgi:hypothetical protein